MSGVCAAFSNTPAFAQPADLIKNSPDWTRASVVTDGGAVYSAPDFDAKVSDYLAFKAPIWVTKKAVPGQGGLGLFHRVRYKDKSGFMADTDIRVTGKEAAKEVAKDAEKELPKPAVVPKKHQSKAFEDEEKPKGGDPLYFRRYVGAALSQVNYTEKFSGNKYSDKMTMYGLRMSGPGALFDGPPLDFNLWFSLQKPGYYSKFTSTPVAGFLVFGDIMAILPFYEWGNNNLIYYGIGMMYTYTRYKVTVRGSPFDSQEFRVGLDFDLGYAHRFNNWAVRGDVKYYYEKTHYFGYILSLQHEY